jgi:hypothetical protein
MTTPTSRSPTKTFPSSVVSLKFTSKDLVILTLSEVEGEGPAFSDANELPTHHTNSTAILHPFMRSTDLLIALCFVTLCAHAAAQHHGAGTSPPTAPVGRAAAATAQPILPASSGMGALQFVSVNYGVPAPQSLTRQLQTEDERTRAASLSAIGAPPQYLQHGHVPYPHSVQLDFVALSSSDELDAIITVELDQHLVSAILLPDDSGNWKRIATVTYSTAFLDPATTPATFLRLARSMIEKQHYRAVFHATTASPNGDFTEYEAHLRILNNRAVIIMSFASNARLCNVPTAKGHTQAGCELTRRWLQADPGDDHRFTLITGTGHIGTSDEASPFARANVFQMSHLRNFSCQPFIFSDASLHYEPTANPSPCLTK